VSVLAGEDEHRGPPSPAPGPSARGSDAIFACTGLGLERQRHDPDGRGFAGRRLIAPPPPPARCPPGPPNGGQLFDP